MVCVQTQPHSFRYGYLVVPAPSVKKTVLSPIEFSGHSCQKLTDHRFVYFWTLSCCIDLYAFPYASITWHIDCCGFVSFEIGKGDISSFILF